MLGAVIRVNINFGSSVLGMILEGGGGIKGTLERVQEMGKYPLSIYPKAFQIILLTLIPYASISYVPAAVLLGKADLKFFLVLPVATALCIGLRKWLFKKALEKYEGSGN